MRKCTGPFKRLFLITIILSAAAISFAQPAAKPAPTLKSKGAGGSAEVVELKLESTLMARTMPYRVLTPKGYKDNRQKRYPVIYLLHGLTGHYTNWTDKTGLAEYAFNHQFMLVTPEGDNGWYTDSVATPTDKYESYIIKELIPEIDLRYRTFADREHRIIAGLSMGGYGSLKFGLKYPEMFSLVGSFSGALAATQLDVGLPAETPPTGFLGIVRSSVNAAFGPKDGDGRKNNDIYKLVRDLTPDKVKGLPFLYESCGTEDVLIASNREFMSLLAEKKVPHEYREHPGIHDWVFWNEQVREFLAVAERRLKKK